MIDTECIREKSSFGVGMNHIIEVLTGADTDNGAYGLYPVQCRDVLIEGVRITIPSASADLRGPSTDGIDVDSSQDAFKLAAMESTRDAMVKASGSGAYPRARRRTLS